MKCALCNGRLIKKLGPIEFNSKTIGRILVPNLKFLECNNCGDKIFTPKESDKAIDFIAEKERDAITALPIRDFITANEAAKILGITKQAFSKHPKIKRGLIYFVKIGNRKYYNRKSIELFKEKSNGKYLLPKYENRYVKSLKKFILDYQIMKKFNRVIKSSPREKNYGDFRATNYSHYFKYTPEKIHEIGRA